MRSPFVCLAFVTSIALAAITTSPVRAQPMRPPPPPRVGLEIGGGLQAGNLFCQSADATKCNGTTAAGGVDLDAAWFFDPRLGVFVDIWGMAHTENNFTIAHDINTVGLEYRLAPVLYVQAGVGVAHAALSYSGSFAARSDNAFGVMGAIGLEVLRAPRWDLSIEARAGTGFYGQQANGQAQTEARNVGLGAQLTFFGF